jgi:hypothetical protein
MAKRALAATALPPNASSTTAAIGLRGSLLYLAAGLVTLLLAIPFTGTVAEQLASVAPRPAPEGVYDRIREAIRRDRPLAAIYQAMPALQRKMPRHAAETRLDEAISIDPSNGLFDFLRLLVILRATPADTQPAAELELVLTNLRRPRPVQLHGTHARRLLLKVFTAHGLGERQAAAEAQRMSNDLLTRYTAALRELGRRIEAMNPAQADQARAALARAWKELLADSPLDVVALAASEELHKPAQQNGPADAGRFREDWHRRVDTDRINMIPWPGGGTADLAQDEHDAMLAGMVAALTSAATSGVLLAIGLVSLLAIAIGSRRNPAPVWRCRETRGRAVCEPVAWLAALAALLPLLAVLAYLWLARPSFTWLLSIRSLPAVTLAPFITCVAVGAAVYAFTRWPASHAGARLSPRTAGLIAAGILAIFTLAVALLGPGHEPGQPPVHVQRLRRVGQLAGLAATLACIVWTITGWRARRRAGVSLGAQSRGVLAVVSRALLACSLLTVALLALNARRDAQYQRRYAAAVLDPITDRLGPGWDQRYFHVQIAPRD